MNEPTPEQLLKVINKSEFFRDTKDMILFLHLHIEHYINELVCQYAKKELHETLKERLTFDSKISFLKESGIIVEKDICSVLKNINKIRNFLSHRLLLTPKDVWDKLETLSFSFKMPYVMKEGEKPIDLGKEYKKFGFNKLDKFRATAQLLVGILYARLRKIRGKELDQFFYPKFGTNKGKEICWVLLYKLDKKSDSRKT